MCDLAATLARFLSSQTETNEKLAAAQDCMAQAELTATVPTGVSQASPGSHTQAVKALMFILVFLNI